MLPLDRQESEPILSHIHDLHELVEFLSEKLENPVTIEAQNFELIAYSSNHKDFDLARRETILSKKVPHHIVDHLKQQGYIHLIENSHEPVRIPAIEEIGLSQRIAIRIEEEGMAFGHIWVQETSRELSEEELRFLKDIVRVAARIILKKSMDRKTRSETKDQLFYKIIQGQYANERLLKLEAEIAGIFLPDLYSVVVFSYPATVDLDRLKNMVKVFCVYAGKTTYWLEFDQLLVVLIGSPTVIEGSSAKLAVEFVENVFTKLDPATRNHLRVGIGKEYSEMARAKQSYMEAIEVINLARSMNKSGREFPHLYQELGLYRLLPIIHEKNKADQYVNPDVVRLIKHDQENNADLLQTLQVYLANNRRMKETAEALHIHPNTLTYRIKKIQELTNLNLEDINLRIMLYIDLLLYNSNLSIRESS